MITDHHPPYTCIAAGLVEFATNKKNAHTHTNARARPECIQKPINQSIMEIIHSFSSILVRRIETGRMDVVAILQSNRNILQLRSLVSWPVILDA